MQYADIAVNKFNDGFNCAQSIVFAFSDRLQSEAETGFRAATGFGGGMGRKQSVCGAVTGGAITLSLLLGRGKTDGPEKQEATYSAVRRFMEDFERQFGTVNCGRLLDGCNLLTPEGQARFTAEKMKAERCCRYVEYAAALIDTMIAEPGL